MSKRTSFIGGKDEKPLPVGLGRVHDWRRSWLALGQDDRERVRMLLFILNRVSNSETNTSTQTV